MSSAISFPHIPIPNLPPFPGSAIPITLNNFGLSAKLKTYELDGRQQDIVSGLALTRISGMVYELQSTQISQINQALPALQGVQYLLYFRTFMPIVKIVGLLFDQQVIDRALHSLHNRSETWFHRIDSARTLFFSGCSKLEAGSNVILNRADPLLWIASLTMYVAMIALGQPVIGGIGLFCLAVIATKRIGYLPAPLDRLFTEISPFLNLYSVATTPMFIPFKIGLLILFGASIFEGLNKNRHIARLISCILPKSPWQHNPNPQQPISADFPAAFKLNPSSVHAREVVEQIPSDFLHDLEETSFEDLYARIDEKMQIHHIELTAEEERGWDNLKNAALHQRYGDTIPANMDKLSEALKGILYRLAHNEDPNDFETTLREFAIIGNQCSEGWWRECAFFLTPQSKDNIAWNIHHHLSLARGRLIQNAILQCLQENPGEENPIMATFRQSVGGENGIHFHNQIHMAMRPIWRSQQAELYTQIQGESLSLKLLSYFVTSSKDRVREREEGIERPIRTIIADVIYSQLSTKNIPPMGVPSVIIEILHDKVSELYTEDFVIDSMLDAITPQLIAREDAVADVYRAIPWESITAWITTLEDKGVHVMNEDYSYDPRWVVTNSDGHSSLTREAVQLLLWDLNILTPVVPPPERREAN